MFKKLIKKINDYGILVMFSHTIFSFSFALISMLLAAKGLPDGYTVFWIVVAFLGARTGANGINRVIDAAIDLKNPRTAIRQIPQGLISKKEALIFSIICFIVFEVAAYKLSILCFILSPIALGMMIVYSYTKRFTWACHIVLGITSAIAPVGAWIATTGTIEIVPLMLGTANFLWVAGFDIIYGTQDYDFDRENGIYSIPAYFGIKNALRISRGFHIIAIVLLILVGIASPVLGMIFFSGISMMSVLLVIEHTSVSHNNLKNAKFAAYNINQIVSIVFLLFSIIDVFV